MVSLCIYIYRLGKGQPGKNEREREWPAPGVPDIRILVVSLCVILSRTVGALVYLFLVMFSAKIYE